MAIGGAVFTGNSKLFEGALGIVRIGFKGYDLGKTTADTTLTPDQDIKDIIFQQDGTKSSDNIRTGMEYVLNCVFGEISTGLLTKLMAGVSTKSVLSSTDSGTLDKSLYQSMLDNEAGGLKIAAIDADGNALSSLENILNFYDAIPVVTGELINWGADTQRNIPVSFHIKWHEFASGESSTKVGAFGYWGDPTTEDVPAIVYPDVEAPILVSADSAAATTITVTFNENVAFKGGGAFAVGTILAVVNGVAVLALSAAITAKVVTVTFAAATFSSGDVITLTITDVSIQDTASPANVFGGVEGYPVTNSI